MSEVPVLVSVVVPAHNESAGIGRAVDVIGGILETCQVRWEIVVVDDGSRDDTYQQVCRIARRDPRVKALRFSRNFGKEAALLWRSPPLRRAGTIFTPCANRSSNRS